MPDTWIVILCRSRLRIGWEKWGHIIYTRSGGLNWLWLRRERKTRFLDWRSNYSAVRKSGRCIFKGGRCI
ncbi:MAG TPA: hypothetical protein VKT25_13795, partial [Ktedonobacteraceae bacterium]|nr:hypothetical protein [Ktedonobacteraceae bacterium]